MKAKVIPLRAPLARVTELSDAALVAACAVEDPGALSALYHRHHQSVYRFLGRLLGGGCSEIDDLVQQVFLTVWQSADRFRGQSAVTSWVFGIAANLARRQRRREARRIEVFSVLKHRLTRTPEPPEALVSQRQLVDRLAAALSELPHDLQVAYLMCEVEEISGVEAAKALGVRQGTMWRRLHDARKRLRAALAEGNEP